MHQAKQSIIVTGLALLLFAGPLVAVCADCIAQRCAETSPVSAATTQAVAGSGPTGAAAAKTAARSHCDPGANSEDSGVTRTLAPTPLPQPTVAVAETLRLRPYEGSCCDVVAVAAERRSALAKPGFDHQRELGAAKSRAAAGTSTVAQSALPSAAWTASAPHLSWEQPSLLVLNATFLL